MIAPFGCQHPAYCGIYSFYVARLHNEKIVPLRCGSELQRQAVGLVKVYLTENMNVLLTVKRIRSSRFVMIVDYA